MTALSIRYGDAAALPVEALLSMIPSLPRAALDRIVERMIDRMDTLDGDTDLEDSETGSPWVDHRGRFVFQNAEPGRGPWHQDDEEDDPAVCDARDDGCGSISLRGRTVWGYEGWEV